MFLDRRGLLLGFAIVLVVLIVQAGMYFYERSFETELARVIVCTEEENPTTCARPLIEKLLRKTSGSHVLAALAAELPARQCHYMGHVVGQQLYRLRGDMELAFADCDHTCDAACTHGIVGQAFAEELGYGEPSVAMNLDLQHLDADALQVVGNRLCTNSKTCHGVGHALFQMYGAIEPGVAACKQIAPVETLPFCYHGLFMEYADVLSFRNMRPVSDVEPPSISELPVVCDYADTDVAQACFRYLTRTAIVAWGKTGLTQNQSFEKLRNMCMPYDREYNRVACIVGIGVFWSYSLAGSVEDALKNCRSFESERDQAACHIGQISVAPLERELNIVTYCDATGSAAMQKSCYQGMFYIRNFLSAPLDVERLCKSDVCRVAAAEYELDPLEQVARTF